MILLDAIRAAAAAAAPAAASHPIVLNPPAISPPASTSSLPTPLPASWSLPAADDAISTAASFLSTSLAASPPPSLPRFHSLLASFLTSLSDSLSLSLPPPSLRLPTALAALSPHHFPSPLAALAASHAARLSDYDTLLALTSARLLPHPPPLLLHTLDTHNRPDLVCSVLRQAAGLRSSELLSALRCFLSPASDEAYDAMVGVKNQWRVAAVAAVEKCGEKGAGKKFADVARRAAFLLMMGHDGFTSPEVCLHYLLASGNVDAVVLGAAVAELDGAEVVGLVRYLLKWVGKYQRFPEARACPEAAGMLGLEQCDSVPPFVVVVRALGLVLDQHFSYLVLNLEVREELRAADAALRELAAEAEACGRVLEVMRLMRVGL